MNRYKQLTLEERHIIYSLKKERFSQSEIAKNLYRYRTTIWLEVKLNSGCKNYRPKQAHNEIHLYVFENTAELRIVKARSDNTGNHHKQGSHEPTHAYHMLWRSITAECENINQVQIYLVLLYLFAIYLSTNF